MRSLEISAQPPDLTLLQIVICEICQYSCHYFTIKHLVNSCLPNDYLNVNHASEGDEEKTRIRTRAGNMIMPEKAAHKLI